MVLIAWALLLCCEPLDDITWCDGILVQASFSGHIECMEPTESAVLLFPEGPNGLR